MAPVALQTAGCFWRRKETEKSKFSQKAERKTISALIGICGMFVWQLCMIGHGWPTRHSPGLGLHKVASSGEKSEQDRKKLRRPPPPFAPSFPAEAWDMREASNIDMSVSYQSLSWTSATPRHCRSHWSSAGSHRCNEKHIGWKRWFDQW